MIPNRELISSRKDDDSREDKASEAEASENESLEDGILEDEPPVEEKEENPADEDI